MANNFKTGPNLVTSKKSQSFATAGFTSTNVAVVYGIVNGVYKSWRPERNINGLTTLEGNKGYLVNAKIDFENIFFTPPLLIFPNVTYDATTTTITGTFSEVVGAAQYQLNYRLVGSGSTGTANGNAPVGGVGTVTINGLTPGATYEVWLSMFTDTNFKLEDVDNKTEVTTDAS